MRATWSLFLLPGLSFGQDPLHGRVTDAANGAPIAYCSVVCQGTGKGTLSNEEGFFALPMPAAADSLVFSMVGYARRTVASTFLRTRSDVPLTAITTDLRAVEVRPDQDALYSLVARCARKLNACPEFRTKLYFELGTHMDDKPVEVLEAFYNARVHGPGIAQLDLEHGRIGIAPVNRRFFTSHDVTRAMSMLDILSTNDHFPIGALRWTTTGGLRKHFRVSELARTTTTVHVLLVPRDTSGKAFTLDAWLDLATALPLGLSFSCARCARHPFVPLRPEDRIERIDMRASYHFKDGPTARGELEHMELEYTLDYSDSSATHTVHTNAVMRCFDRDRPFLLPLFDYDARQTDYRKITFQPYDSAFWAEAPALLRTARQEQDRAFFAANGYLTGSSRPAALEGHPLFECNYAYWAPDRRISLRTLPPPDDAPFTSEYRARAHRGAVPGTVHLEVQLYMDVDTTSAPPRIRTATVFDGFRSYYLEPEQRCTDAFLNIFFDLCEMERRELDRSLRAPGISYTRMCAMRERALQRMHDTTAEYERQVQLGTNVPAMLKWNQVVKDALGIDNLRLDGLQWEDKQQ